MNDTLNQILEDFSLSNFNNLVKEYAPQNQTCWSLTGERGYRLTYDFNTNELWINGFHDFVGQESKYKIADLLIDLDRQHRKISIKKDEERKKSFLLKTFGGGKLKGSPDPEVEKLVPEHVYHDLIMEVFENFDFHTVWKTMKFLDWRWIGCGDDGTQTPYEYEIKRMASQLINGSLRQSHQKQQKITIASGGLKATADVCNNYLALEFVLNEWDTGE